MSLVIVRRINLDVADGARALVILSVGGWGGWGVFETFPFYNFSFAFLGVNKAGLRFYTHTHIDTYTHTLAHTQQGL